MHDLLMFLFFLDAILACALGYVWIKRAEDRIALRIREEDD